MKHVKLFEAFVNEHKSTEDMSSDEIRNTINDLEKKKAFKVYYGKETDVTDFLRNLTSEAFNWVQRMHTQNQVKVYDTPDEDSKHEIEDMIAEFGLNKIDLNSLEEETDQQWIEKNHPEIYDDIVRKWCDWSAIDWKKYADEAGRK